MAYPSPETLRKLAELVARSVATDAGIGAIPHIDRTAATIRLAAEPELAGMAWPEVRDACQDIAALARTATVTVTIPEA